MREAKKFLKYEDLTIAVQCMWNVKTMVTQVVIVGTGSISKSFMKYLPTYLEERHQGTTENSHTDH